MFDRMQESFLYLEKLLAMKGEDWCHTVIQINKESIKESGCKERVEVNQL
jgi:hypothetical protein